MYVNLRIFRRALAISLFRRPFSLRRWAIVFLFCVLFWTVWTLVAIGRGLDVLLFPGFLRQEVREPTFIIAPPRSGTTFLQKTMCLDADRFVCVKLWETIFPSITYLKAFDLIGRVDAACGGLGARLVGWSERRFFGGWDDMHRMSFTAPEEDEAYFVYTLVAESTLLLFPYPQDLRIATRADELPERERHRLMQHYRSCVQRFLYARGPDKTLLAKTPGNAGRIRSLLESFPDARIISIIRHPYETLPSHVSLTYAVWQVHSPEIAKASPETEAYAEIAVDWYRNMFENRDRPDPRRYAAIRYEDLVGDPARTVRGLYQHFGWEMGAASAAALDEAAGRSRSYQSAHEYSLEEYGLDEGWVQERLGDILDAYSLPRG
jgi:hypothetical protein